MNRNSKTRHVHVILTLFVCTGDTNKNLIIFKGNSLEN